MCHNGRQRQRRHTDVIVRDSSGDESRVNTKASGYRTDESLPCRDSWSDEISAGQQVVAIDSRRFDCGLISMDGVPGAPIARHLWYPQGAEKGRQLQGLGALGAEVHSSPGTLRGRYFRSPIGDPFSVKSTPYCESRMKRVLEIQLLHRTIMEQMQGKMPRSAGTNDAKSIDFNFSFE